MQLVKEKANSEFKPVKLRLKIDLVSYPARARWVGKYEYILPAETTRIDIKM